MLQLSQRPLSATEADAALFLDRERELAALRRAVQLRLNSLLLGDTGAGKTSLVHQLERALAADGVTAVHVDGGAATSGADLVAAIGRELTGRDDDTAPTTIEALAGAAEPGSVVIVDGPPATAVHELFGRHRDELWQLPFTWLVTGDAARRSAYLEPPADAFFDVVVELPELSVEEAEQLLRHRVDDAGDGDEAAATLRELTPALAARTRPRTPRQVLAAAREALLADDPARAVAGADDVRSQAQALGRSHAMLFAELEALGPVSASDPDLLDRLGWTRARAVQVLRDLEERGLVDSSVDRSGSGPGRPPKLYAVKREHNP